MTTLQKAGGVASLILGGLFLAYLLLLAVILPGRGLGPGVLNDPAKGMPLLANSPLPGLIGFIYLGISVVFVLIRLALYDRLPHDSLAVMQVVVVAGLVASTLFLATL